ncbi:hypothetical protein UlMin_009403 [Ulmus minor]
MFVSVLNLTLIIHTLTFRRLLTGPSRPEKFGYETPHLRLVADKAVGAEFFVVVRDFFHRDPFVAEDASRPIASWLEDHPLLKGFLSIGAAGFCWDAKTTIELSKSYFIQAAMILLPSYIPFGQYQGLRFPFAIFGAELDTNYPSNVLKQYKEILKANTRIDSFVKFFPNVRHGWTLRYNDADGVAVKAAEEAHQDLIN